PAAGEPPAEGGGPPFPARCVRSLRDGARAADLDPVVRADGIARAPRDRGRRRRKGRARPRLLAEDLRRVDEEHPRLAHPAPALLVPPTPGKVVLGGPHDGLPPHAGILPRLQRGRAETGRRRPGYPVLPRPPPVLDDRLARGGARTAPQLSPRGPVHGARHP